MYVDLGDFRYLLAAEDGTAGRRLVSVVTSRGLGAGYVHVTDGRSRRCAGDGGSTGGRPPGGGRPRDAGTLAGCAARFRHRPRLLSDGHAALDGLEFPSGSAALPGDGYASLSALAAFLEENPSATVVLVGHTDAVGALDANTASVARPGAVRPDAPDRHLRHRSRASLAEGAGYLAPVASNLTPEGRAANRRVEVVLLAAP
jgi:OmpA-OmpF porin, OOP family